jgi:hypothetical protein
MEFMYINYVYYEYKYFVKINKDYIYNYIFMIKKIQVLSLMHKRAIVSAFISAASITTNKI